MPFLLLPVLLLQPDIAKTIHQLADQLACSLQVENTQNFEMVANDARV